ncbi:MAG: 50S ribosomal protein L11 methyltransferase [Pseudomonadota bacterium]
MSWLQLTLPVTAAGLESLETLMFEQGAISVTLISGADEPVLEPDPGQTPVWDDISLQAVFDIDTDLQSLRLALADLIGHQPVQVEFVGAQDWREAAANFAVNQVFADRLWLRPRQLEGAAEADQLVPLLLEPGLAFGSGSHPTTQLCLTWLAQHLHGPARVLDFGCGSGILAIAAALLMADSVGPMPGHVVAVDHDPQALLATNANATYNGLAHKDITTLAAVDWYARDHEQTFDIVVANILAAPLQDLAEEIEAVAKPGAHIVLSGILADQAAAVAASYSRTQFAPAVYQGEWVLLQGLVT